MSAYRCPSCGTSDPLGYVRCNQSSCPDGRDPRPQSDAEAEIASLRAQVASLQKELAERTAERDEAHEDATLDCARLVNEKMDALERALVAEAECKRLRRENAELLTQDDPAFTYAFKVRAEAAEARVEWLEAALEMIAGKRQCIDNLMSNVDIALAALAGKSETTDEGEKP